MEYIVFTTFAVFFIKEFQFSDGLGTSKVSWETRYLKDLESTYNEGAPPVTAQPNQLNVSLDIGIIGIDGLNEKDNTFTASFVFSQTWIDLRLQFNSSDYGGLDHIVVPKSLVWIPDIVPWNTAAMNARYSIYGDVVAVLSSGRVYYTPIETVTTKCSIDVTDFPSDVQTCTMWFGSWSMGADRMTLSLEDSNSREMDIALTLLDSKHPVYEHPQWALTNNKANVKVETKSMDFGKWEVLFITANLKRRDSFYNSLSVGFGGVVGLMIPFLFLLPAESPERTILGLLILVGFTLLILGVQTGLPLYHSTIPRIGRFNLCSIAMSSLSVIISVILRHIRMREVKTNPVPSWLKSVCLSPGTIRPYLLLEEYTPPDMPYITGINLVTKPEEDQVPDSKNVILLNEVRMYVRYISGRVMGEETKTILHRDWEEIVRVVDRVMFLLFFLVYLTTALALIT